MSFSRLFRSRSFRKSSSDKFFFSIFTKNFWAWDRACVLVLVPTCYWTFLHSFPKSFNASRNR